MRYLVCRANDPVSLGIQFRTSGRWSHVALVAPNGVDAIECVWPRVRRNTVAAIRASHSEVLTREVVCPDDAAGWAWALATVGARYDLGAILGILADRDWADPGQWYCSEHLARVAEVSGHPMVSPDYAGSIFPQFWAMVGAQAA